MDCFWQSPLIGLVSWIIFEMSYYKRQDLAQIYKSRIYYFLSTNWFEIKTFFHIVYRNQSSIITYFEIEIITTI